MAFGLAVLRAGLSFGYWLLVLFCLYGAVAGDRRSDAPPPTLWETYAMPVAIVVVAILLHAGLSMLWSSLARSRAR